VHNNNYSGTEWHQKFVQEYKPCGSFSAHKHTTFGAFFKLLAQVCQFMVSTTKELPGISFTGVHLQSRGYKVLVEFYL